MASKSEQRLVSDVSIGSQPISAVTDIEDEEVSALGFAVWVTTGDVIVPIEWLEAQFEREDLPEWLLPSRPWKTSAYKKAVDRLLLDKWGETMVSGRDVKFRIEDGSERRKIVYADVFWDEEEIGVEGGDWRERRLGSFDYDMETEELLYETDIEAGPLIEKWNQLVGRTQGLYRQMQDSYDEYKMSGIIRDLITEHSTAIPLRHSGAIYFFPSHYADHIESLSRIWDRMNQFKQRGRPSTIDSIPVVNDEERRKLIQSRVEETVEDIVMDIFDAAIERLTQNEEETAISIAEDVVDNLSETQDLAAEYSKLLETKLSVKRQIEDYMSGLEDEKEELAEEVLKRADF